MKFIYQNKKFNSLHRGPLIASLFFLLMTQTVLGSPLRAFEHSHLQDFNLRVCNQSTLKCLEVNSEKSSKSLLGDIFSLKSPKVHILDSQTLVELERWQGKSGYWDLKQNRVVIQLENPGNKMNLVEMEFDLENLKTTTFNF